MDKIGKDVIGLIKDAADPISYGRLLCTSKLFHPVDPTRKRRKLNELLAALPKNREKPLGRRSPYTFFVLDRPKSKHLWKTLTPDQKKPYQKRSLEDSARVHYEKRHWSALQHIRRLVEKALVEDPDEEFVVSQRLRIRRWLDGKLTDEADRKEKEKRKREGYTGVAVYGAERARLKRKWEIPKRARTPLLCYIYDSKGDRKDRNDWKMLPPAKKRKHEKEANQSKIRESWELFLRFYKECAQLSEK